MNVLGSLVIACSMYSKIPMPQIQWTRERMRYVMCFFPLVGVIQGGLLWGFAMASWKLELWALHDIGGVVLPILINGGIHMDGFLDVVDAKASYGDKEKKLDILKDPHVGAFAILGCAVYLMLYLAVFAELPASRIPAFAAVYVLTRGLSGLSVVWFPKAKASGLVAAFSDEAQKHVVAITMAGYVAASLGFISWSAGAGAGLGCALAAGMVFWYYYRMAVREFGGITGDLAGYFLQVCELVLLAVLAVTARL